MRDDEDDDHPIEGQGTLPRWARILFALSILSMVIGGGLWAWEAATAPEAPPPGAAAPRDGGAGAGVAPQAFVDGEWTPVSPEEIEAAEAGERDLSPAFLRLGFGFFVGFCIGYALRAFFKISAIAIGVVLLAIFGLQYAGVLDMQWDVLEAHWNALVARVQEESESFFAFVTGSLPTAGLAGLGLVTGFRRR